jgi:LysM domain
MPIGKKLAVVLSVVIAGTSVALFFRKDASGFNFWQKGPDDPFRHRVERRVTTDVAWAQRSSPARATSPDARATRVATVATAAISQPKGLGPESQPTYQKNFNPVGALLPPIEGVADEEDQWASLDGSDPDDGQALAAHGGPIRHVVEDGDTLSKLAVRYLGHAEAYLQIFQYNRDVLASPDLLPIGAVLKIPPRREARADDWPLVDGNLDPATPLHMVPVPDNDSPR